MDHYIEIRLLPDPEFAPNLLMNALYSKLHRALARLKCSDIGTSFPAYSEEKKNLGLGDRMRLHGTQHRLKEFMNSDWLRGMNDHVRIGSIISVPGSVQHAIYRRVQTTSNVERIRRRQMRRLNLNYEQAVKRVPDTMEKKLDLPFVMIKSSSTAQTFRLFIKYTKASAPIQGNFNAYGLSKEATVPFF